MAVHRGERGSGPPPESAVGCGALHRALCECHRRVRDPWQREASCRHLNRSLAECLVAAACPEEAEAVRAMCSSVGTSAKRAQCQKAKLDLSVCLSSLQTHQAEASSIDNFEEIRLLKLRTL
ncbi:hypothetical protein Taro_026680 [Colocasia esculenta]|uniref:COX assembly mitochondrial protein n=1 Tax=Colocasia esculenta TaxID=4460 RepID=A0A843VDK5_COLES|nr:hypothetical protein [Colocasia esculenta]